MFWSLLTAVVLTSASPAEGQRNPYCDVYGIMHEVQDQRKADYIVYEEETESFADVIIYDQDNRLYANAPGHWHFVGKEHLARFNVYFTTNRDRAHFSVFFTEFESFAGCNN